MKYLKLIALILLIPLIRPPGVLVTLGEQREVRTNNALTGVHTRFVDEVEERKIKRGLEMVREMGAPWVVEFFPWAYYEKQRGVYDWRSADRIVDHANRQGLTVIARLGFVPEWARPARVDGRETTWTHLDDGVATAFAEFAAAFAAHFAGRVRHLQIWNEPNLSGEVGMQTVNPAQYAALLRAVYPLVKRANPDAIVLAGALAPTRERDRGVALDDLVYLDELYAAGARDYFDALAVHNYGMTEPPESEPAADRINFRRIELLREVMTRHGDGGKPAYITETGWNDDARYVNGVTPAQRIDYTLRALAYARAHWPWARCVVFWVFKLPAPAHGYRDAFTFVTPSLEPLPIYEDVRDALVR
jgi:hypothetical protein